MSTAEQYFDNLAPQFSSNPAKSIYLEIATSSISGCNYGTQGDYAIALLAAHIATLSARGQSVGATGSVTSVKEGDLSIGYGSISGVKGTYASTSYGLMLMQLMKSKNVAISVTGGNDNGCMAIWPEVL